MGHCGERFQCFCLFGPPVSRKYPVGLGPHPFLRAPNADKLVQGPGCRNGNKYVSWGAPFLAHSHPA